MSSICGDVDFYSVGASSGTIYKMARAMRLRGRGASVAYIKGGVSLHQNNDRDELLPLTILCDNRRYTLLLDGRIDNATELAASLSIVTSSEAETVLKCYIAHGTRCFSMLRGAFALAIYDERTKELFLARDALGAKPLFYAKEGSRLLFASEINGLISALGRAHADRLAVRELVFSEIGEVFGEDIYPDISELPPAHFATLSRLGLCLSAYTAPFSYSSRSNGTPLPFSSPTVQTPSALDISLYAHGYPCFDAYTEDIISELSIQKNGSFIVLDDPARHISERYALERADRLGAYFGLTLCLADRSDAPKFKPRGISEREKKLTELLGEQWKQGSPAKELLGASFIEKIKDETSAMRRVRSLGIACQIEPWLSRYPIFLV